MAKGAARNSYGGDGRIGLRKKGKGLGSGGGGREGDMESWRSE